MFYINIKVPYCGHFWHFIMGEFLPVVYIMLRCKRNKYYLYNKNRKWGQCFDKFYKELGFNIEFTNNLPRHYLMANYIAWDYKWSFNEKQKCKIVVNFLKKKAIKLYGNKNNSLTNKILIQYRKTDKNLEQYFLNNNIADKLYGSSKRTFKDMDKIHTFIENSKYLYHDNLPLLQQIMFYLNENNLILEHGAGMVFILFMNHNSKILEIITPNKKREKNGAAQGANRLCYFKKAILSRVIIENNTSVLDHKDQIIKYL